MQFFRQWRLSPMASHGRAWNYRCAYLVLLLLVNGCAQIGGQSKKETPVEPELPATPLPVAEGSSITRIPKPQNPNTVDIPSQARSEFDRAKKIMQAGEWAKAKELLLLMTETYPLLAGVYTNLGITYQHLEQFEDAKKAYQLAIETNPYNFDAYANLGILQRELGEFTQAKSTYLAALALWPHHRESVLNLGVLYDLYLGDIASALDQFKLAQQLNSEEDRKLKGWIIDIERRLARQSKTKPSPNP